MRHTGERQDLKDEQEENMGSGVWRLASGDGGVGNVAGTPRELAAGTAALRFPGRSESG